MIVLDTNVLSEILRPVPDERPMFWLEALPRRMLFTTTITRAEIFYGVRLMSDGQRKEALHSAVKQIFLLDMAGQVLGFDNDAADRYAEIAVARKKNGTPISHIRCHDRSDYPFARSSTCDA